jgi:hypothetical protein
MYGEQRAVNREFAQAAQNAGMVVGAGLAQAPQRQLEVPGIVDRLDRRLTGLAEAVNALDNRLSGYIARPEGPQPAPATGQIKGATSTGLGGQLDGMCDAVEVLTNRLHGLMERLEA